MGLFPSKSKANQQQSAPPANAATHSSSSQPAGEAPEQVAVVPEQRQQVEQVPTSP